HGASQPAARRARRGWPYRAARTRSRAAQPDQELTAIRDERRRVTPRASHRGKRSDNVCRRAWRRGPGRLPSPLRTPRSPWEYTTACGARASVRFFEKRSNGFRRNMLDEAQFNGLAGQEAHSPVVVPIRDGAARDSDEVGLLRATQGLAVADL